MEGESCDQLSLGEWVWDEVEEAGMEWRQEKFLNYLSVAIIYFYSLNFQALSLARGGGGGGSKVTLQFVQARESLEIEATIIIYMSLN